LVLRKEGEGYMTLTVTNPQNNEVLAELPLTTTEELSEIVDRAKEAQKEWAKKSLYERSQVLYHFADVYEENIELLTRMSSLEMGKPYSQSLEEVAKVPQNIRGTLEYANHMYGEVLPDNDSDTKGDLIFTKRVPLGVVGCIIPFNYPIELTILKVIPALVMGNAVVVKAPSSNPTAILKMGELLIEAGVPADLAPFLVCSRDACTEAMVKSPKVDAIGLTGSTTAGIQMMKDAADCLKPMFLELGGNDPFIICEDADLDTAVEEMVGGRLFNTGQTCCAPKRFIVQEGIIRELTERLVERLKTVVRGDVLDPKTEISTLISEAAAITVEKQVEAAVFEGARIVYGGHREGAYFEPAVLVDVTREMAIAIDDEIFGPVFPMIAYKTDEEAIEIANQSCYGLNGGVLSQDIMRAFRIANQIEVGSVVVNGHSAYRHIDQGHGGVKMSGLGREGISTSLEEFSQLKNYVLKGAFR